jgi:hypothetical protein
VRASINWGDAHLIARALYGSLDNGTHIQLPCYFRQLLVGALVMHGGSPRNHSQGADLPEIHSELFSHSISEILLFGITRKIGQRKNRDRPNVGRAQARQEPSEPPAQADKKDQRRESGQHSSAPPAPADFAFHANQIGS